MWRYAAEDLIKMCAQFGSETIRISEGQRVIDILKNALEKKGLADKMEDGFFIIDDVIIKSIDKNNIKCVVEYEY